MRGSRGLSPGTARPRTRGASLPVRASGCLLWATAIQLARFASARADCSPPGTCNIPGVQSFTPEAFIISNVTSKVYDPVSAGHGSPS